MSFTLCNDFFVSGHAFSWRGGDEKSRWSERGGLLISVAVISEIGGLTAGAVRLSRQTVIHPHSKNIGIHASRNASLVRALMSVSRKLCARSPSMGKREDSCEPWTRFRSYIIRYTFWRNIEIVGEISEKTGDSRWTCPLIYSRSFISPFHRYLQLFHEKFTQGNSTYLLRVERDAFQSG